MTVFVSGLRLALTTFTIVPLRPGRVDRFAARVAMASAPVLGALLGLVLGGAALGLRALRHLGLAAFAPATEGAAAKLGRVLPDSLRDSANAVEEVVAIEPGPWVISTSAES